MVVCCLIYLSILMLTSNLDLLNQISAPQPSTGFFWCTKRDSPGTKAQVEYCLFAFVCVIVCHHPSPHPHPLTPLTPYFSPTKPKNKTFSATLEILNIEKKIIVFFCRYTSKDIKGICPVSLHPSV